MANNWKYFQATGLEGGTPNPSDNTMYVDSHNGSDVTGDGSHDSPFQTLQKVIDAGVEADVIVAGLFEGVGLAGDFTGVTNYIRSIIAEGAVEFDGEGVSSFVIARYGFNYNIFGTIARRNYGTLIFKNYTTDIGFSATAHCYNTEFYNCANTLVYSTQTTEKVEDCVFNNCNAIGSVHFRPAEGFRKNTIIASPITFAGSMYGEIEDNYFDATSTFYCLLAGAPIIENNFFEGTLTNKITLADGYHDNIESAEAAFPLKVKNNLASTTVPLFNDLNNRDYTLQEASPLKNAGKTGRQIGYGKVAKAIDASDVAWTLVNIDNTTTSGEAVLSGSPTGTMETLAGVELFPKSRKVTRINLPDFEFNSPLGEMIGNLAADNTPYLLDVEIKYSDDNITFNTNWLRTAIGVQPMHDTTNDVGTDDPLYSVATAEAIVCRYMKFKITLRDNETQI